MRLIYYGVSADEEKFIKRWSFSNKIPVTIINEGISSENVHFAGPHDGVCLYPSPEMRQSELLYRKLREQGIHQLSVKSTGVDGINFEWAEKYGLTVTNVPSYSPTSVGHFAIMSILMVLRNIPTVMQTNPSRKTTIGRELQDVTVGILGTGRIGCVVAEGIHALGGRVIASSSKENPRLKGKVSYVSFEELLEQSDVLSIHIPLSEKSTHLFSQDSFCKNETRQLSREYSARKNRRHRSADPSFGNRKTGGCGLGCVGRRGEIFFRWLGKESVLFPLDGYPECYDHAAYCLPYRIGRARNC